jgi:hypothetical protein
MKIRISGVKDQRLGDEAAPSFTGRGRQPGARVTGASVVMRRTLRDGRAEVFLVYLSTWVGKPQADWKMRVSMKTSKNIVRYPFALSDVPLP